MRARRRKGGSTRQHLRGASRDSPPFFDATPCRDVRQPEQHGRVAGWGGGEDLALGGLQADLELLDLARPAEFFGFGDAFLETRCDRLQSVELGGIDAEHGAADAGVLVFAAGSVFEPANRSVQGARFELWYYIDVY